jgi:hypothetical protein
MSWFDKHATFDTESMALIKEAFEAAWHELCSKNDNFTSSRAIALRHRFGIDLRRLFFT